MNNQQHDQLFTDLMPEQAAVVEGGAYFLESIECLTATADPVGNDEPYINADGRRIWSGAMGQGDIESIGVRVESGIVSMYDADSDSWGNPDDPIGTGILDSSFKSAYVGNPNGGSYYRLTYSVVP